MLRVILKMPMKHFLFLLALCVCISSELAAQKTTVVHHYPKDTTGLGSGKILPSHSEEHRIIINYYEHADELELNRFEQLVSSYLSMYVEKCALIQNGDVKLRHSKRETLKELNSIVKGAVDFYDYRQLSDFSGFSKVVEQKLASIDALDFRTIEFSAGDNDQETEERMRRNFLDKELSDLKMLVRMEVGMYGEENLMVVKGSEEIVVDDGAKEKLLEQYTSDDKWSTLEPIRVDLDGGELATIDLNDYSKLNTTGSDSNTGINAQLLELLQANNTKLDGMQKQIDELRSEQLRLWQQSQDEKNVAMQKQIDDLREMVFALVKMNTGEAVADGSNTLLPPARMEGSVTNLPGSMNVYFPKGSVKLDAGSVLSLNEIVDILARSPQLKLIVTGYADKSGDAAKNLVLSQQRANSVKEFLVKSGLSADRFITKYYGDRDSEQEGLSDRKVVIEFVR
jgi:outer membrane protein OmpA-like peptidoglycan-associated protein